MASTATRAVVLGMFLVPNTVLRSLATGAIIVAIISIAVALTFHPALLMALGDRVDRLSIPWLGKRVARSAGGEGRFWGGAVRAVTRHPTLSLAAAVVLPLLAASPLLGLKLGAARRVIFERWSPAWWSNPLTGATVPYTQTNKFTAVLAVPSGLDSATTTIVGETIWTDPQTHKKVLRSVGRQVIAADGTVEFRSGQQPFLDAFVDGDLSVFDAVCAALAS